MKADLGLGLVAVVFAGCATPVEEDTSSETQAATVSTCVTLRRSGNAGGGVADAYISSTQLRKNFGERPQLRVSARDEALLRFDLSAIPASATVTRATLKLFANEAGDGTIRIHRVTAPWQEGSVTYQSFHQAFASATVGALRFDDGHHGPWHHSTSTMQKSVDLTQLVGNWVRGTQPNHGIELDVGPDHHPWCDRDGDEDNDPTLFASSDAQLARRPALEVCYSVFVDECAGDPCHHGGTCTNDISGFTCACAPGWGGATCDVQIDHCAANPCQHGGGCANTDDGYTCVCPAGFAGANCETDIDDCATNPCSNGGVCSDGVDGYTCACVPGYDGANCEHLIDNCVDSPCHNAGTCTTTAGGFACACAPGYAGTTCDTNIDDCIGNACANGTCVDGIGGYSCACSPDWGGAHCDVNLDTCAQTPCLNGGSCTNGFGSYTCACASGYAGTNCEIDFDDCATAPCQNGGVCVDGVASYSCMCDEGTSGTNCEVVAPPPVRVRIDGVCFRVCQTAADPDGNGWSFEAGEGCIMPDQPQALNSPFCDTPQPQGAYEAPHASTSDTTTSVATIPRPDHITVGPRTGCPQDDPALTAWNPAWTIAGDAEIPPGTRVLVRGNDDIPATVLMRRIHVPDTSALVFADMPATFKVTDIFVEGSMHVGSESCRLDSNIKFEFDTDEDVASTTVRDAIYARMGLGIMIDHTGVLEMFGQLYQPTWTRLGATANIGATSVTLSEPVDWRPGQQFVIATSRREDYPFFDENEVRIISSVSGNVVTFTQPLAFKHYGGAAYQVEVGLLTRTLQFRTSDRVVAAAPTFGGHIMVHSKNARLSGVELFGMGQQNRLARYPFHFHRSGDVANASYFTDSSVWHSNFRCAVIHRTDRALVSRNVAFDNFGHCFYFEDGLEMNNEMSFNLAVRTKFIGPTDRTSVQNMGGGQEGFTVAQSADLSQPADRAAAGFYITNGNNKIVGNASSGGFAGYSFPNLPRALGGSPERIFPIMFGASHFDGNTAHSSGYFWNEGGACIYIGGILTEGADGKLTYKSGRSTEWDLLRHYQTEVFNNTKTFLCETGIVHWGNKPRLVNFEAWDNGLIAKVFGTASIESSLSVGATDNVQPPVPPITQGTWGRSFNRPLRGHQQGFQFYDTATQTILSNVVFRSYHHLAGAGTSGKEFDQCALLSMTHSNEFTPQRMNAVAGIHYGDTDEAMRLCVTGLRTDAFNPTLTVLNLASRNFNVIDTDGSLTSTVSLPPGPRLVASVYADAWNFRPECVRSDLWGTFVCPLDAPRSTAAIGVTPDKNARVTTYTLDPTPRRIGENYYSPTEYLAAQISAPSGLGWHHAFENNVWQQQFTVRVYQVPELSFVLFSTTLPSAGTCSIVEPGWTHVANVATLLASTQPVYTTVPNPTITGQPPSATCFIRIPQTNLGVFEASGLSVPNMQWQGTPYTVRVTCPGCAVGVAIPPVIPASL